MTAMRSEKLKEGRQRTLDAMEAAVHKFVLYVEM